MAYSYKSAIAFGLVYIPVKLYSCVRENDISFNLLDKKTKSRIKYKKTCEKCAGAEVNPENIVKGYEYDNDKYVIFTEQELEKLKTKKDKTISITQFVDLDEIDPIFFARSFYVEPVGAEKAYILLQKTLSSSNKVGIAKTVLGNSETLIALRAFNDIILASTLYFYDEIAKNPINLPKIDVEKSELNLAKNIVTEMTKTFKPAEFKDEYQEKIARAIEQKIAGKEIISPKDESKNLVANLMDALSKSLENLRDSKYIKKPKNSNKKDFKKATKSDIKK